MYSPKPNYGNRLQNYAVQTVLERLGLDTVTYAFERDDFSLWQGMRYWAHRLTGFRMTGNKKYWKTDVPRYLRFERFNRQYIKTKRIEEMRQIDSRDFYVIGSDQVWNPYWYRYNDLYPHMYLLDFAEPEKRVCFSPSFGIEQLPEDWKPWFRENLKKFPELAVREEAGARIIKELTGRDAAVMVDPTMLLTAEDWRKISKKPNGVKEGYILTYFLEEKTENAISCLNQIRGGKNIYELFGQGDRVADAAGPQEFLWLFDHADIVVTDSFHACVFSMLFNKPFLVFERDYREESMNSRLETLLKKFGLERKCVNFGMENDVWEHDYAEGYRQLEGERKKTMDFLMKAIGEKA